MACCKGSIAGSGPAQILPGRPSVRTLYTIKCHYKDFMLRVYQKSSLHYSYIRILIAVSSIIIL